ncbi:MAG: CHASE domain-containing protein [Methylotenera sp.]|nr:CHASE domain-containing protein [Methylotenera sp.]MDO9390132.1 CHASE domain-containing protein [Methylotenera sp.]
MTLIVSLLITYQAVNIAKIEVKQKTQVYFDYRVRDATNLINQRMQAYRQVLLGAAGLFKTSNNVERHEFKQYVETLDLAKNYPGIQGVGFSLIVPSSKKTQHIASIRSEGFPEYTIRPDSQREIYTSIVYLEPFSGRNLRAFGYDMFSETVRHAAMQKAIDSGQTTLSGKVKLVQETGKQEQAGFLMYMPIYSNGTNNDTPSARREHIIGWVYAPFRMNDLMDGLFGEYASDLGIRIFDGESMSGGALMYDSDGSSHPNAEISKTVHLQIVDHPWTMHIRPLPIMSSRVETNHPKLVAIIGTIISVLLTLLIWFLATGRDRAIHAAKSMNNELITERQRLSSIIEGTHVGTWEWNVQTGATNFNEYWANIIGYELSELEPISIETWMKFVHPDDAKVSGELLEKHFSGELAYYECEARMRHKDGRWIWVLDRGKVTAWTEDGKPSLMAGTHQDITERKHADIVLSDAQAFANSILNSVPNQIIVLDNNGVIVATNASWQNFAIENGLESAKLATHAGIGINYLQATRTGTEVSSRNGMNAYDGIRAVLDGRIPEFYLEYPCHSPQQIRWFSMMVSPLDYKSKGVVIAHTNITDRKEAELEKQNIQKRFNAFYELDLVGLAITSPEKGWVSVNHCLCQMLGYSEQELMSLSWEELTYPDDLAADVEQFNNMLSNEIQGYSLEKRFVSKTGRVIPTLLVVRCSRKDNGEVDYIVAMVEDITERKNLELELTHQAHLDYLTGLANRRHFMEQAEVELSRAIRYNTPLSILMLDIDLFKNVNDTYGHQMGDTVLQVLSKTCQDILRQVDVVGRIGGEEFAVILPETEAKEALEVAERLREAVASMEVAIPSGLPIHFTISIGVTTLHDKNVSIDMLLNQADKALYEAKETGRNKVCVG